MERVIATPALLLALLIAIAYSADRTVLSSQIASLEAERDSLHSRVDLVEQAFTALLAQSSAAAALPARRGLQDATTPSDSRATVRVDAPDGISEIILGGEAAADNVVLRKAHERDGAHFTLSHHDTQVLRVDLAGNVTVLTDPLQVSGTLEVGGELLLGGVRLSAAMLSGMILNAGLPPPVCLKAVSVPAGGSPYLNANDDGTSIGLWTLVSNRERWVITEVGAYVTIGIDVNMTTRVYLGSNPDGTVLTLWKEVTADQQWVITDAGDYITIHKNGAAAGARKYLSVALGAVRLWSSAGAEEQWTFNCTVPPPAPPPVCFGYFAGQYLPGCVPGEVDNGACPDKGSMAAAKAACIAKGNLCGGLVFEGTWQIRGGSTPQAGGDHAYPMGNSYCTTPCWDSFAGHSLQDCVAGDGCFDHGSLAAAKTACIAKGTLCGGVLHAESGAWQIRSKTSKDLVAYGPEHAYPKTANWDHENAYCPR